MDRMRVLTRIDHRIAVDVGLHWDSRAYPWPSLAGRSFPIEIGSGTNVDMTKTSTNQNASIADFLTWTRSAPPRKLGARPGTVATAIESLLGGVPDVNHPPPLAEFVSGLDSYVGRAAKKDGSPLSASSASQYIGRIRRAHRAFLRAAKRGDVHTRATSAPPAPKSRAKVKARRATTTAAAATAPTRTRRTIAPPAMARGDAGPFGKVPGHLLEQSTRILAVIDQCPDFAPRMRPLFLKELQRGG